MSSDMSIADEAERYLQSLAAASVGPEPTECLRCYVRRMVSRHGCDGGLRFVRRWQEAAAALWSGLPQELEGRGGYCDCEVVLNVFGDDIVAADASLPLCPSATCLNGPESDADDG